MKLHVTALLPAALLLSSPMFAQGEDDVRERLRGAPVDTLLRVTLASGEVLEGPLLEKDDDRFRVGELDKDSAEDPRGRSHRRSRWVDYAHVAELQVLRLDGAPSARELAYHVRIGDDARVYVADDRFSGRVEDFDAEWIRIDDRVLRLEDVSKIELRQGDSLTNGALIGLGVGAGLAALACTAGCDAEYAAAALLVYGASGAGIGVLIDAAFKSYTTIYVGPDRDKKLSFAPLLTPDKRGVAISISF